MSPKVTQIRLAALAPISGAAERIELRFDPAHTRRPQVSRAHPDATQVINKNRAHNVMHEGRRRRIYRICCYRG